MPLLLPLSFCPQSGAFCHEHPQSLLILNLCFASKLCLQVPCKDHSFRPWFVWASALFKTYWPVRVMLSCLPRIFSGSIQDQQPWWNSSSWDYKLTLRESLCCPSVAWSQFQLTEILSASLFLWQQLIRHFESQFGHTGSGWHSLEEGFILTIRHPDTRRQQQ